MNCFLCGKELEIRKTGLKVMSAECKDCDKLFTINVHGIYHPKNAIVFRYQNKPDMKYEAEVLLANEKDFLFRNVKYN